LYPLKIFNPCPYVQVNALNNTKNNVNEIN